ncbi:hypothetical protein U1Q18_031542 [Sarracenia purpurea var. burkii]
MSVDNRSWKAHISGIGCIFVRDDGTKIPTKIGISEIMDRFELPWSNQDIYGRLKIKELQGGSSIVVKEREGDDAWRLLVAVAWLEECLVW